jgi:hypothetical protein
MKANPGTAHESEKKDELMHYQAERLEEQKEYPQSMKPDKLHANPCT